MSSHPTVLGNIGQGIFEQLRGIAPADSYWQADYRPDQLVSDLPVHPSRELYETIQPLAKAAIDDFTQTYDGVSPTEVRLHVSHSTTRQKSMEKWHQLLLFPKAFQYEAVSDGSIDFAVGKFPGLSFTPNSVLNGLTRGLTATGLVDITSVDAGKFVRTDTYAIKRHLETGKAPGVILLALDLFNGPMSLDAIERSRSTQLRARIVARKD